MKSIILTLTAQIGAYPDTRHRRDVKIRADGYMGCTGGTGSVQWTQRTIGERDLCFTYVGNFPSGQGHAKCVDIQAQLPLPTNELENKDYRAAFDAVGAHDGVLLGANDVDEEGTFVNFVDGAVIEWAQWYTREPNNSPHFEACCDGEDFVQMNNPYFPETETANLGWNDIPSNFASQVVCVKPVEFIPTTSTTTVAPTTTTIKIVTNIVEMSVNVLNQPAKWINYGCAGRGAFAPFEKTSGQPLDEADRAFALWKSCYQCATGGDASKMVDYDYDTVNDSCIDSSDATSRAQCECDRQLIKQLEQTMPNSKLIDFNQSKCIQKNGASSSNQQSQSVECCNYGTHYWRSYNVNAQSCCADGVRPIGTC